MDGLKKIKIIDDSHLGILISNSENFGISVAEFLARGRPVIISKDIAIYELIENTNTYWLYDKNKKI